MQTLSIVISVYNERSTILEILKQIEEVKLFLEKEIIIVDDFSNDGTRDILKSLDQNKFKIIFNEKNLGKGYSIRKGFKEVTGDFVIIQDADLEYSPNEYEKLLEPIILGSTDIVYGSRFKNNKFIFKPYYFANKFLTFLSNFFTDFNLTDMETCFKCFTKESLVKIRPHLSANRFEIEPEITAISARMNLRIKEIPILYNRRSYAGGKKIGWWDGLKAIWAIIKN